MKKILFLLFVPLVFASCRKKALPQPNNPTDKQKPIDSSGPGTVQLRLHPMVDNDSLELNRTAPYKAPNGEEYVVTTFNYYVSHIVFIDAAGNRFEEPESYHLVRANEPASQIIAIDKVPEGRYKTVEFLIGVDSARNVSGAQDGDLRPELGMFWSWKTGYIMAKMEGLLQPSGSLLEYHIAGFSSTTGGIRKVTITISSDAVVTRNKATKIDLKANLNSWFYFPNFAGFNNNPSITSVNLSSTLMANNYANMFSLMQVVNP